MIQSQQNVQTGNADTGMSIPKNLKFLEVESIASCEECGKCNPLTEGLCCQTGSGYCISDDLPKIAGFLKVDETTLKEKYLQSVQVFNRTMWKPRTNNMDNAKPYGPCIFFKAGVGCQIHSVKPLQCRVGSWGSKSEGLVDWFQDNYAVDSNDPASVAEWSLARAARSVAR